MYGFCLYGGVIAFTCYVIFLLGYVLKVEWCGRFRDWPMTIHFCACVFYLLMTCASMHYLNSELVDFLWIIPTGVELWILVVFHNVRIFPDLNFHYKKDDW